MLTKQFSDNQNNKNTRNNTFRIIGFHCNDSLNEIRGYNAINLKNGYMQLDIRSPKEIVTDEN
jgi:hypothetical protein